MNLFFNILSTAGANGQAQSGGGSAFTMLLPMIIVIGLMLFFQVRSQKKEQKNHQNMIDSLAKGDEIILRSGIHAIINHVKDKTIVVKLDDSTKVEVEKWAVGTLATGDIESSENKK